jgi:glycosyltransferase involved in cell wall biosynthesis
MPTKVSLVIPCFNAADKIGRCLASLRAIDFDADAYEVLFVDDCSTDGTHELLQKACEENKNWRLLQLERNSGSPSRPRNRGIDQSKGEYVFFLDCDDEILPQTLRHHYDLAQDKNPCLIRSELWADDGRQRQRMNQLSTWEPSLSQMQRKELIISRQSTVSPSFVKLEFLRRYSILWPETIRMGEDTLFLAKVLAHAEYIEYLPEPSFIYKKLPALTPSSTQKYGARELNDHLTVWREVQSLLLPLGIDYFRCRLQVGLQTSLVSLIYRGRGDIDTVTFDRFAEFVVDNWSVISSFRYISRYRDILEGLRSGDFATFSKHCRPRLVIAGYDLKFITSALPELSQHFDIRLDEWKGHDAHDEKQSRVCLEWAEVIWCEWLLGNAVWYARHKRQEQRLIVRMHRMELGRDYGDSVEMDRVDAFLAVSVHFFERLLERFRRIPRSKVRLVPNFLRTQDYIADWSEQRLFTLGMVGILPSRKRFDIALQILNQLRQVDKRYRLEVFGQFPEAVSWVSRNSAEMAFFERCHKFIDDHQLKEVVSFRGHSDVKTQLTERSVGFVLSVSDSERNFPGFESFHLAVADGFASGGVGLVLSWLGAEFVWPDEFIFREQKQIVDYIISCRNNSVRFQSAAVAGREFVQERYDLSRFVDSVVNLFHEII